MEKQLTPSDAIKFVKASKGLSIFICVGQHGTVKDSNSYFHLIGNVITNKTDAVKFIKDAYGNFEKRDVLVDITTSEYCLFIGRAA